MVKNAVITWLLLFFSNAIYGHAHKLAGSAELHHSYMKALSGHMGVLERLIQLKTDSSPAMLEEAEALETSSRHIAAMFPEGSGGSKSKTKPEIWSKRDDFSASAKKFQDAASRLVQSLKVSGGEAHEKALKEVGDSCESCHKAFRLK